MKTIYLAGGCFWGMQKFLDQFDGVIETEVGYANGPDSAPSYEEVCRSSGHAETVRVEYDEENCILRKNCKKSSPVPPGSCKSAPLVRPRRLHIRRAGRKLAVLCEPVKNFFPAEEYHQKYLEKNPGGYCHIPPRFYTLGDKA